MKAFDARCEQCGGVHIVWVGWDHEVGDVIKIAHARKPNSCREYGEHTLISQLDGLSDFDKWGPEEGPAHNTDESTDESVVEA